tara:strand:+ start:2433 stop:3275 length:843 start_codon:yes stop_codon:yes gene_type:complete
MFKNKDNLIIFCLVVLIVIVYIKKYYKQEHFEVIFSPYYPISNQVGVKLNNVDQTIEDNRLDILKKVLKKVKLDGNDGNDEYYNFNYANRPVIKNSMSNEKLKPITNFIMEAVNNNLPEGHKLVLIKLEHMGKMEIETEVLVNFQMVCEYKITSNKNYTYKRQEFKNDNNDNNLVIDVEVVSIRKIDDEKLHLNTLNIIGMKGEHLPGSNFYNNGSEFLFTESLSNKIIDNKKKNNSNEMNKMNNTILPENDDNEDEIDDNEDTTYTDINTEEAESFFDI